MAIYPLPSARGSVKTLLGANPAANAEVSDTVGSLSSGSKAWFVVSMSISLVQGITQTPQPILRITDGTSVVFESFGSTAAQAVSTTCQYTWAPGLAISGQVGATTNVHSVAGLPNGLILLPNYVISTVTVGIGANTDYGPMSYLVCELG